MNPIRLVRASAGSGKTYFLMEELSENISAGVRPEGLLATTFTEKAAAATGVFVERGDALMGKMLGK